MLSGWAYRAVSAIGSSIAIIAATGIALYVVRPPEMFVLGGRKPFSVFVLAGFAIGFSLLPLYRPRPRRVVTVVATAVRRIVIAAFLVGVVGYVFFPTTATPAVVALTSVILLFVLPPFYWLLNRRPEPKRILVVGNDPRFLKTIIRLLPVKPIGFVSPKLRGLEGNEAAETVGSTPESIPVTDGSGAISKYDGLTRVDGINRLGGLSRLRSIVRRYDIDTIALGFRDTDRGEFFGAIEVAHEHGIRVIAHESHAECVLVSDTLEDSLIHVTVAPWPWYSCVAKRAFDVVFAAVGLIALLPVTVLAAVAIKLDSSGPIFYSQTRTSAFGGTFTVLKLRTMDPKSENPIPEDDEQKDRITRVGRLLRKTHADELPQLWSILVGDMSVVGPRATWIDEERVLESDIERWRSRWLVKPGLTGLAQVNRVTSTRRDLKLKLDLRYIRNQSMPLDVYIVSKQIWLVLTDVYALARRRILRGDR